MRKSTLNRNTNETKINCYLNLDGDGNFSGKTGIGFLDHMLELFTKHGDFDITIEVNGDLYVDDHHTIEDMGIVLGSLFTEVIGDKKGINRYGFFVLPMDEVLTTVAFDYSGRYSFIFDCKFDREKVGEMSTELVYDFFDAFAQNVKANLIIKSEYGRNDHHKIEGIFKSVARAIKMASTIDLQNKNNLPSTKGLL
jgi:imidazoleglycerol phosphate dehydratase HisB